MCCLSLSVFDSNRFALILFNFYIRSYTFTYKKFVSVRHAYILRNNKKFCKRKKKKKNTRESTHFFFFFKLKDRTKKLQEKDVCTWMRVVRKKKKRFPLSLFVENCRMSRIPSMENCRTCRVGHPRWKIAIRKIPTTQHLVISQLTLYSHYILIVIIKKKRVTNFWIEYIYCEKEPLSAIRSYFILQWGLFFFYNHIAVRTTSLFPPSIPYFQFDFFSLRFNSSTLVVNHHSFGKFPNQTYVLKTFQI